VHAFRKDLADIALAGQVIASHYVEPLGRRLAVASALRTSPQENAGTIADLPAGTTFLMLEDSAGWAWGYAGERGRVGYVPTASLATA
jgi:hypothetical protein